MEDQFKKINELKNLEIKGEVSKVKLYYNNEDFLNNSVTVEVEVKYSIKND